MSEPLPRPHRKHAAAAAAAVEAPAISEASGHLIGTPEKPIGVPLAAPAGASTQARCKTCRPSG